jgi:hypothetical protein
MNGKLRVLVITNENVIDSAPGQKEAIRILAEQNWIESVEFVSHSLSKEIQRNYDAVETAIANIQFDILLIWSPKNFPETRDRFEKLLHKLNGRPIYYWEGDPWVSTGIKSWTEQMKWWAQESQLIFTVAKEPHTAMFRSTSDARIFFIPQTYCHVQFKEAELTQPFSLRESNSVVMIGSQTARIPFVYGTPGSGIRFLSGITLKMRLGDDFQLFGSNWPRGFSAGKVDYAQQANLIRKFSLSANWDNFIHHESYVSDRLPISLLAGRVHVTSSHPGSNCYGSEDIGLVQVSGLGELHRRVDELRALDPLRLTQMGLEAHNWARNRFSHRESARFMFSKITNDVPSPQLEPWRDL